MWTGTTTRKVKVHFIEKEYEKAYDKLLEQNKQLLTKMADVTKLVEQMKTILLSTHPHLAEQLKEELEKINEQTDDTGDKSESDTTG